jgi:hypothetical protein
MNSLRSSVNSLEWRRNKVLELSSQGRSQPEIARLLQISQPTVNRDIAYLRQQAKENIKRYIDERLPLEYQKCLVGLDNILSKTWDIANNSESLERDRLQAVSIGMQAYSMKIDLLSSATVVERAIQFVENHHIIWTNRVVETTARKSNFIVEFSIGHCHHCHLLLLSSTF